VHAMVPQTLLRQSTGTVLTQAYSDELASSQQSNSSIRQDQAFLTQSASD